MGLETVTHISDLDPANPDADDPKSQGDNHLRNIKTALKTDLPNITGPVTATQAELNVLAGLTGDGVVVKNGGGTIVRTITAGAGISVANGDGASGNPTISVTAGAGLGDVNGPGSSVDGHAVLFDGTTGKLLKSGGAAPMLLTGDQTAAGTKTLSGVVDVTGRYQGGITAVAALNIDCSAGNYFTKTINGASTFTVSGVPSSKAYSFTLELTHTSGTVTWFSGVQWPGSVTPSLTTGKTHLFIFVTDDGGTRWRGAALTNYTN